MSELSEEILLMLLTLALVLAKTIQAGAGFAFQKLVKDKIQIGQPSAAPAAESDISVLVSQMHELLSRTDDDGVPIIYASRNLAKAMDGLSDRLKSLSDQHGNMARTLDDFRVFQERIERDRDREREKVFELVREMTSRMAGMIAADRAR